MIACKRVDGRPSIHCQKRVLLSEECVPVVDRVEFAGAQFHRLDPDDTVRTAYAAGNQISGADLTDRYLATIREQYLGVRGKAALCKGGTRKVRNT